MFRYHQVLYRRLLRRQSPQDLLRLRSESATYPHLIRLIDAEMQRREVEHQESVRASLAAISRSDFLSTKGYKSLIASL